MKWGLRGERENHNESSDWCKAYREGKIKHLIQVLGLNDVMDQLAKVDIVGWFWQVMRSEGGCALKGYALNFDIKGQKRDYGLG